MKVTHLNTYCTGGAAKACLRITKAQYKSGIDAKMLVLYKNLSGELMSDIRGEWSRIENYRLKFVNKLYTWKERALVGNNEELFSLYDPVWNVASHSLIKNADVVNLHWVSGFLNFSAFFNKVSKKVVFTLHDHYPFSGGYHYPNTLFLSGKYPHIIQKNRAMLRDLYSRSDIHFVGPSQYIIDQFNQVLGGGKYKTSVIKNPVDSGVFFMKDRAGIRVKYGYKENDRILLFLNEHLNYKRKGFQVFNSLLPKLNKKGIHTIVIGVKTGNNDPYVHDTGYLHSDQILNDYYNMADLLIVPSLEDNLPNVISEANCAGTPVIAFDTGGIKEMIREGDNGNLVPLNDVEGLFCAIENALEKVYNRSAISKRAHDMYSEIRISGLYREVYK